MTDDLPKTFRLINANVKREMVGFSVNLPTDEARPIVVTFELENEEEARTLAQNNLSHKWYEILAKQLKEETAAGWKRFCKLHYGVPILRAENKKFRASYDEVIRPLPYEQKIKAMDILPVTSIMTTKQLSQYLEDMRNSMLSERGILLEFPADESYEQLRRG